MGGGDQEQNGLVMEEAATDKVLGRLGCLCFKVLQNMMQAELIVNA